MAFYCTAVLQHRQGRIFIFQYIFLFSFSSRMFIKKWHDACTVRAGKGNGPNFLHNCCISRLHRAGVFLRNCEIKINHRSEFLAANPEFPGSIPGVTSFFSSSESGTGSTQPL
jgi:hypothetical protein